MKTPRLTAADAALAYAAGVMGWYPWVLRGYLDLSPFKLGVFLAFTLLCVLAVILPNMLWVLLYHKTPAFQDGVRLLRSKLPKHSIS